MTKESKAVREWTSTTSCYPLPTAALEKVCADADRVAELELEIGETCDLVGEGGDNTLFGRCESMLTENASLRAGLEKVREYISHLRSMESGYPDKHYGLTADELTKALAGVDHG